MRFSVIFASLVAVIPAFAAPTSLLTVQRAEGASSGRLIVRLKDTASKTTHLKWLNQLAGSNVSITHQWSEDFLNGYAGYFDNEALAALQAPPDVASISEDGIMRITATVSQTNAPWGLSRISQNGVVGGSAANTNFVYRFDSSAGAGVDIFVVDTGQCIELSSDQSSELHVPNHNQASSLATLTLVVAPGGVLLSAVTPMPMATDMELMYLGPPLVRGGV